MLSPGCRIVERVRPRGGAGEGEVPLAFGVSVGPVGETGVDERTCNPVPWGSGVIGQHVRGLVGVLAAMVYESLDAVTSWIPRLGDRGLGVNSLEIHGIRRGIAKLKDFRH